MVIIDCVFSEQIQLSSIASTSRDARRESPYPTIGAPPVAVLRRATEDFYQRHSGQAQSDQVSTSKQRYSFDAARGLNIDR
jgi:hypothetical protein